jgi:hypothetical protein
MVYISNSTINRILSDIKLIEKYPQISTHQRLLDIGHFISQNTASISSTYQKNALRFFIRYNKFIKHRTQQVPFDNFIHNQCNMQLHVFKVCYENDLNDLISTKFLVEIFNLPIEKIIEHFVKLNMIVIQITWKYADEQEIIGKIMTRYMVISLARIFAFIDFAVKNNFAFYLTLDMVISGQTMAIIADSIVLGEDFDKIIIDPKSKLCKRLTDIIFDLNNNNTLAFIKGIYEHFSRLYNCLINKKGSEMTTLCLENPDLNAVIGRYFINERTITKRFVTNNIITIGNWILLKWINDVPSNNDNNNNEIVPLDNLILPANQNYKPIKIIEV